MIWFYIETRVVGSLLISYSALSDHKHWRFCSCKTVVQEVTPSGQADIFILSQRVVCGDRKTTSILWVVSVIHFNNLIRRWIVLVKFVSVLLAKRLEFDAYYHAFEFDRRDNIITAIVLNGLRHDTIITVTVENAQILTHCNYA
ncbi:hypothetical protein PoB_002694800 [Plakobranchus ocellatus]|uniref:Uncharacterized protein n=1 Tax=Plakobranchus ocellatus TaxID=259542 RepID=A0AAV3ZZY3_9GAST|nr:hypothetical protein PoB_002694800 [Plakobranchus ocellatus]